MRSCFTRRELLSGLGCAAAAPALSTAAPAAPVAIARCATYGPELLPTLARMFDQIGGLGRLVKGKTVAMKVNLTGTPESRMGHLPPELTHWTHPEIIGATTYLMGRAGATRIRILESPWKSAEPLEEIMLAAGWEPRDLLKAAPKVEFENTNYLGRGKEYFRFPTPHGGHMFRSFDLNHSYRDCDVFVSIAKMKVHSTAGITLSIKNCFGITPCTIYGDGAGEDEPGLLPLGGRYPLHVGNRQPSKSSAPENDPATPRDGGFRIPRIIADLVAARPVDLAIIDAIRTKNGDEGTGGDDAVALSPGLLIAGTNCVCTDAIGAAVMGFDPMAERGTAPFEHCDSTMALAEKLGVGTRDPRRIEVIGAKVEQVRLDFRRGRSFVA